MTLTGADLRARIELLMKARDVNQDQIADTLTAGYGYALSLDARRIRIERRITELAADAEDARAATELRKLWLEHRTLSAELTEMRDRLGRLREARFVEA